jgi:hypothetical protein
LKSVNLSGPSDITLSHLDLTKGSNFILIKVQAGKYGLNQVYLNNYSYFNFEGDDKWSFSIEPQTISYVGHIEFRTQGNFYSRARVELVNRSTEAVDFLNNDFPFILQSRELFYGGPGEDDFFNYIGKQGDYHANDFEHSTNKFNLYSLQPCCNGYSSRKHQA